MSQMTYYVGGKPIMVDYTPTNTYNTGDVIVIGDMPFVAHVANPPFGTAVIKDALGARGGIYAGTADVNSYQVGTYVYWDPTDQQFTATGSTTSVPFGWIVGLGANNAADTTASTTISVLHDPSDDTGMIYVSGQTANDNITNTGSETAFARTAIIPAGTLEPGDTIHVRAVVLVTGQNSTNTNNVKLKMTTAVNTFTQLFASGAVNAAANAVCIIDADILVTANGNAGSFQVTGDEAFGAQGTATRSPFYVAATAFNTNIAITVEVTDTQSAASTGNVTQLVELIVEKKRK